jgi:hypothetical protein
MINNLFGTSTLDTRDLYPSDIDGIGGNCNGKFYEPDSGGYDGGGDIVYRYIEKERPHTLGNKIGDYVARTIDFSVGKLRGLLKLLEGKNYMHGAGDSC